MVLCMLNTSPTIWIWSCNFKFFLLIICQNICFIIGASIQIIVLFGWKITEYLSGILLCRFLTNNKLNSSITLHGLFCYTTLNRNILWILIDWWWCILRWTIRCLCFWFLFTRCILILFILFIKHCKPSGIINCFWFTSIEF